MHFISLQVMYIKTCIYSIFQTSHTWKRAPCFESSNHGSFLNCKGSVHHCGHRVLVFFFFTSEGSAILVLAFFTPHAGLRSSSDLCYRAFTETSGHPGRLSFVRKLPNLYFRLVLLCHVISTWHNVVQVRLWRFMLILRDIITFNFET